MKKRKICYVAGLVDEHCRINNDSDSKLFVEELKLSVEAVITPFILNKLLLTESQLTRQINHLISLSDFIVQYRADKESQYAIIEIETAKALNKPIFSANQNWLN